MTGKTYALKSPGSTGPRRALAAAHSVDSSCRWVKCPGPVTLNAMLGSPRLRVRWGGDKDIEPPAAACCDARTGVSAIFARRKWRSALPCPAVALSEIVLIN